MLLPSEQCVIVDEPGRVTRELRAIGLTREIVRAIAVSAAGARADSLSIDPQGTPGTLSYIHGVRAIRLNLLPRGSWRESRVDNVEATVNDKLGVQICFQNVEKACSAADPKAVSGKGSASRRLIQGCLFDGLLDPVLGKIGRLPVMWFVCVSVNENGYSAEVSCPLPFEGNQFEFFAKRIFVIADSEEPRPSRHKSPSRDEGDGEVELAIEVSKK